MASQQIKIQLADDELKRFQNQVAALGEGKARVGMARATNRVTRMVRTRVIREIVKQSSIPRDIVARSVNMKLAAHAGQGPVYGVVFAKGDDLSLKHFRAKQFSFGVKAKIYGQFHRFPGTFIWAGTFRSGQAVANGHVFQRSTSKSLPIELQTGPAVPDELVRDQSLLAYEGLVRTALPARVSHELGRMLE